MLCILMHYHVVKHENELGARLDSGWIIINLCELEEAL